MNDKEISGSWTVPSTVTYIEVADRLALLAAEAQTSEAKLQFEQLAKLYENLADTSLRFRMTAPAESSRRRRVSDLL